MPNPGVDHRCHKHRGEHAQRREQQQSGGRAELRRLDEVKAATPCQAVKSAVLMTSVRQSDVDAKYRQERKTSASRMAVSAGRSTSRRWSSLFTVSSLIGPPLTVLTTTGWTKEQNGGKARRQS